MIRHKFKNFLPQITALFSILTISCFCYQATAQNTESSSVKLTKCSEYGIDGPVEEAIAVDSQRVFAGTFDGSIQAVDLSLSAGVWRTELGGEIVSNLAVAETEMLVVSNPLKSAESVPAESILRSLSKETGVPNWTARLPFSEHFFLGAFPGAITAVSLEGWAAGIDAKTGRILWRTLSFGKITARPSFFSQGVAFGTSDKKILIISPETGGIIFKSTMEFIPTAITNPSQEVLVMGDERGNVALIGMPGGKNIWKFKSGGAISFVSVEKEGLFITSLDNFVYLISMYNGDVVWKRRLPGRVVEGGLIVDGYVATLIYGENSAFLIDAKKGKIVDQLPPSDKNFVNQVPVLVKDSNLLVTTQDAITLYGMKGCGQKTGKAASSIPPFIK